MKSDEFRKHGHQVIDWIADYMDGVREYPVMAQVAPGDIKRQLPAKAPQEGEPFEAMMQDFLNIIMPGITHWQHPRNFSFFPANVSGPSQLADMLANALGVNAMLWETSPAATELEEQVMGWLKEMMDLPREWSGVIQDTASSATFCAILCAREKATDWQANEAGLPDCERLTFYTSSETHSSFEKAVKMAGLGRASARIVPVDDNFAMRPDVLEEMIKADIAAGHKPAMVMATIGATGVGACDPLDVVGNIAKAHDMFFHVDAAWAGSAFVCPEYRALAAGLELADSYVFNPHKWMGVGFDCTAHFVKDAETLKRTLTILPEYLKTPEGSAVIDYRDWGIALGRRMRALKLWFVMRGEGVTGLQAMYRKHVALAEKVAAVIDAHESFEIVTPTNLSLFTFRYAPADVSAKEADALTEELKKAINADGFTYFTRTVVNGRPVIRWQVGQMHTEEDDVMASWERVQAIAETL